jgi:hypothetical protein
MMFKLRIRNSFLLVVAMIVCGLLAAGVRAMSKPNLQNDGRMTREREVSALIATLRDEQMRNSEPEKVADALTRLGRMKAVEAVSDIIRLLDFKRTFDWEDNPQGFINEIQPITAASRYPAIGALFEIGRPSLGALVEVLATQEPGSVVSENALRTLSLIFREKPGNAIRFLRRAADTASSALRAERLSGAAEKLKASTITR